MNMKFERVLVCGGRDYQNSDRVAYALDRLLDHYGLKTVIEGGARGADRLAKSWATSNGVEVETYPADWERYGRSAGFVRNTQMLEEGKPDLVVAFPGGSGTAMMVQIASKAGVPVKEIVS